MKADNSTNERLRALSDGYEAPYSEGAWEQMEQGGRNNGPTPPEYRWTYTGENPIDDAG